MRTAGVAGYPIQREAAKPFGPVVFRGSELPDPPPKPSTTTGGKRTSAPKENRATQMGFLASTMTLLMSTIGSLGLGVSLPQGANIGPGLQSDTVTMNTQLETLKQLKPSAIPEVQRYYHDLVQDPNAPADATLVANPFSATRPDSARPDPKDPYLTQSVYNFYRDITNLTGSTAETRAIDQAMDRVHVFDLNRSFSSSDGSRYNQAFQEAAVKFQALGITHLNEKPEAEKAILKALTVDLMGKRVSSELMARHNELVDTYYSRLDQQHRKEGWFAGLVSVATLSLVSTMALAVTLDTQKLKTRKESADEKPDSN